MVELARVVRVVVVSPGDVPGEHRRGEHGASGLRRFALTR